MKCPKCGSENITAQVECTETWKVKGETENTVSIEMLHQNPMHDDVTFVCGDCTEIIECGKDVDFL